jgi:hypothetical protein
VKSAELHLDHFIQYFNNMIDFGCATIHPHPINLESDTAQSFKPTINTR